MGKKRWRRELSIIHKAELMLCRWWWCSCFLICSPWLCFSYKGILKRSYSKLILTVYEWWNICHVISVRILQLEGVYREWIQLLDNLRANQNLNVVMRALSKCLLNPDKHRTPATLLGNLPALITLTVNKSLPEHSLILPGQLCAIFTCPAVGSRSTACCLWFPSWGHSREQWDCLVS